MNESDSNNFGSGEITTSTSGLSPASLEALLSINQVLSSILEGQALLSKILEIAMATVNAERGFLVLIDPNEEFKVAVSHNVSEEDADELALPSGSILRKAMGDKHPLMVHDVQTDPRFQGSESLMLQAITSAIAVPLIAKDNAIGAVYVDSRKDRRKFTDENLDFFRAFASLASLAYQNASMFGRLKDEKDHLQAEVSRAYGFTEIVGVHPRMKDVFGLMQKILHSDITVFVNGESGTGKELVARALHYNGPRKEKPFIAQFCGNLSEQLLESELFGHKRGSFTGAVQDKRGLFETADGGTFFLDEIADISPAIQTKLLRVLQDGVIRRVGDNEYRQVDVRIISATNKSLEKEVEEGRFREDLFYRLNVISIKLPSLRERRSDIPLLADHFLQKSADRYKTKKKHVSADAIRALQDYDWPGNVRELENAVERAVVLSTDNPAISTEDLIIPKSSSSGGMALKDHERRIVLRTLDEMGGNKTKTAEVLGVSLRWLHYRLNEWKTSSE